MKGPCKVSPQVKAEDSESQSLRAPNWGANLLHGPKWCCTQVPLSPSCLSGSFFLMPFHWPKGKLIQKDFFLERIIFLTDFWSESLLFSMNLFQKNLIFLFPGHSWSGQFSSVQLLSRARLLATPWIAARQACTTQSDLPIYAIPIKISVTLVTETENPILGFSIWNIKGP